MDTYLKYTKLKRRLRAYRVAFYRFADRFESEKAAAILPRIKMMEAEEPRLYNEFINN